MRRKPMKKRIGGVLASIPLYLYCIFSLFFLIYAFINPFKSTKEFFMNIIGLPKEWTAENIQKVVGEGDFVRYYGNSIFVVILATVLILLVASMGAYGLSRYEFRGLKLVNSLFLLGMMFPATIMIIPQFLVAQKMGLVNSLIGLGVIFAATQYSFSFFILHGFFKTLPHEVSEAAKIDGAGEFRIFLKIMMPMAKPVLGTMMTIAAISVWNDYFTSLIMIYDNAKQTLPLALANFFTINKANWPLVFAAVFICTMPIIVVYFFGSKQIVKGLTAGAVK